MKTLTLISASLVLMLGLYIGRHIDILKTERDWALMQRDAAIQQAEMALEKMPDIPVGHQTVPAADWRTNLTYSVTNK